MSDPRVALETTNCADVFTITDERRAVGLGTFEKRNGKNVESQFTGYAILPHSQIANVELSNDALAVLMRHAVGDIKLTLEVINWHGDSEGKSLVLANYDRIIGGPWLAIVDSDTVPQGTNIRDWK